MPNFCSNCGSQITDSAAKFCINCGQQLVAPSSPASAPAKHIHTPPISANSQYDNEVTLMSGICNHIKSLFYVQNGKAVLTNKRFIYLKHGVLKTLAIGLLVNLTEGDIDFVIPVTDIQSVTEARQGLQKTLKINTRDGHTYHFYFYKRIQWEEAFQNALRNRYNFDGQA